MDAEERESIVQEAINRTVERCLLMLPEVMGNLMVEHATMVKMNSQFYKEHPEFAAHKDIVANVLEMIDGQDTLAPYERKLEKAIPEIKSRLLLMKGMDMKATSKNPDRNFNDVDFLHNQHGEL